MKRMRLFALLFAICCFFVGCSSFSKHTVTNTEEIRTEIFLEEPDSVVRIVEGEEERLSLESVDALYNGFMGLMRTLQRADTLKTPFAEKRIKEWKEGYTCFEFRYLQRRNYVGSLGNETELFTSGNLPFDAFLFVRYSGGLIAVPYLEDEYVGIDGLFLFLAFSEETLAEFMAIV